MCKCDPAMFLHTSYTVICATCGAETPFVTPKIQTYNDNSSSSIVVSPYCRKQRFVNMLRKLLGVDSGPPRNDKVWRVLAVSAPFKKPQEIISCLKNSTLIAKHYTCLHVFSKVFLTNYEYPKCSVHPLQIEDRMTQLFDEVLFRWCRYQNTLSFFSYAWLLEKLLKCIGIFECYATYLKILVCPNRRQKYEERWNEITTSPPKDSPPFPNDTQRVLQGIA